MDNPKIDQAAANYAIEIAIRVELARRYAAQKEILSWGIVVFPDKFTSPFCAKLHDYFVDIRHEQYTDTLAPRGFSKTTIKCFLIPIFQALEEPDDYRYYLNVQSTSTKAIAVNTAIKEEFETNQILYEIYGNCLSNKWTEKLFVIKSKLGKEVVFCGIGVG